MPFTPSHAVVALPFARTPLLPAAIAIGAMTPDLPLFLRGTPLTYQETHRNLVLSSVVALMLLVLWYVLLRPAVRELSPAWLSRRLPEDWDVTGAAVWRSLRAPRPGAWRAVWRDPVVFTMLVVLSLVLGVVSHIGWDAFTHEGRWGTRLLPGLDAQWGPLSGYKWLQHGSSVLGLAVLAIAAVLWLRRRVPTARPERLLPPGIRTLFWFSLPIALVVGWGIGLLVYGPLTATWTAQHLAYRVLPPACAFWAALAGALCIAVIVRRRRGRSDAVKG